MMPCNELVIEPPPNAGAGAPVAPPAPPVDPPARPDWFPEKFWQNGDGAHERLAKGYSELEKAFHDRKPADLPADPTGYSLKPEKMPEGLQWSDDVAAKFSDVFHKSGIGAGAAKSIVGAFLELEADNLKAAGEAYKAQIDADLVKLKESWGGDEAYKERVGKIEELVVNTLGADPTDAVLFSNPRVVGFLGKVVDVLGEDAKAALGVGNVAPQAQFAGGADLAAKIMSDPGHPEYEKYRAGDTETVQKVLRLLGAG